MAIQNLQKEIPTGQKRNVAPYTIAQIRLLLDQCKRNFQDMYIPLLLSLTAGTRISETIGLKYSDIDFTSNTIYIDRQLGRSMKDAAETNLVAQQLETKTPNGIRRIPIPDWVADELVVRRAWYEKQKLFVPNFCEMDYICCHCDGTPLLYKFVLSIPLCIKKQVFEAAVAETQNPAKTG